MNQCELCRNGGTMAETSKGKKFVKVKSYTRSVRG